MGCQERSFRVASRDIMRNVQGTALRPLCLPPSRAWTFSLASTRLPRPFCVTRAVGVPLVTPQRALLIAPTEALTSRGSPLASSVYTQLSGTGSTPGDGRRPLSPRAQFNAAEEEEGSAFHFAIKDAERGLFDRGVSPEAKDFIAEAERQYRASSEYLHQVPSGGAGLPETEVQVDEATGEVRTITRVASAFGETYVPSGKERYAIRGHVGELSYQRSHPRRSLPDECAVLNLKKERQLEELLFSSQMEMLLKAREVSLFLASDFYEHSLALQSRNAEAVMVLFSRASLQLRLRGERKEKDTKEAARLLNDSPASSSPSLKASRSGHDMNCIPFMSDMRRLYAHQKTCFVAPTPLMMEQLMCTLSAVPAASAAVLHLAGRIFIDCDKYVVLPTRTTYAAFFHICRVNNDMSFAVARMTDAVLKLNISMDAPMVTAMLRGLNECGYVEEAVALLSRTEKVPMTTPLFNASLETLLLSSHSLSCFSAFAAMQPARLRPDADTYTLLLLACEQSGQWNRVTSILADMQTRRVRGNAQTLNLLLKGLLMEKLHSYAFQLYDTMQDKHVEVWPALEEAVQRLNKISGSRPDSLRDGKIEDCDEKFRFKKTHLQRNKGL